MTLLPKFRQQLDDAARLRARRRRTIGPGRMRLGGATLLALAAVMAAVVAVVVVAIHGHSRPSGRSAAAGTTAGHRPAVASVGPVRTTAPALDQGAAGIAAAAGNLPRSLTGGTPRGTGTVITTPPGPTPEDHAIALVNKAQAQAQRQWPSVCSERQVPTPRISYTNASPPTSMLSLLGVLRRPQTQGELAGAVSRFPPMGPPGVYDYYRRFTRVVEWPHGVAFHITVAVGRWSAAKLELPPCRKLIDRTLDTLVVGQPHRVAQEALRLAHGFKLGPQVTRNSLSLYFTGLGGTGERFAAAGFEKHGMYVAGYSTGTTPHSAVSGLVPDGVRSVTVKVLGAHPYTSTGPVRQNTFIVPLHSDPNSGTARMRVILNR